MQKREENSVVKALSDIYQLESDRVHQEKEAEKAAEAAKKAAEEAAARQAAEKIRLAADTHRFQEEMRHRDLESRRRIESLKAELEAVRHAREAIHREIVAAGELPASRIISSKRHMWMWGVLVVAACGAGLALGRISGNQTNGDASVAAAVDVAMPPPPPPIADTLPVSTPPLKETVDIKPDPVIEASTKELVPMGAKKHPIRRKGPGKKRPRGKKPRGKGKQKGGKDELGFLDKCGSDPMCGFGKQH